MTRQELVRALETELGRPLNADEIALVDRTFEIRRGVVDSADVILLARDIRGGLTSTTPSLGSTGSSQAQTETPRFDPTQFFGGVGGEARSSLDPRFGKIPGQIPGGEVGISPELRRRAEIAGEGAGVPSFQVQSLLDQVGIATQGGDETMLAFLEETIGAWEAEAFARGPTPIGVPKGFTAAADTSGFSIPGRTLLVDPRYFEGDELNPASMAPEVITRIQNQLVSAGLIDRDEVYFGVWDSISRNAYKSALGMANQSGETVDRVISRLVASVPESRRQDLRDQAEVFRVPPFVRPDKATLAQDVKAAFRQRLGRDPTPEDLAWGISGLSEDLRAEFEAQVAAQRAVFDAAQVTPPTLTVGANPPPITQRSPAVQGVDSVAQFREAFEKRYKPEIDRVAELPQEAANRANVFNSLRTMSSLIGR